MLALSILSFFFISASLDNRLTSHGFTLHLSLLVIMNNCTYASCLLSYFFNAICLIKSFDSFLLEYSFFFYLWEFFYTLIILSAINVAIIFPGLKCIYILCIIFSFFFFFLF